MRVPRRRHRGRHSRERLHAGGLHSRQSADGHQLAKLAGLKLCQAYRRQYGFNAISLLPTNLYGPGDNFDLETSHVLPALMRKIHEAQAAGATHMTIWGSGAPRREFMHVDDLADACLFLMQRYDGAEPVNVGCGQDLTIRELAQTLARVIGLEAGVAATYDWYCKHVAGRQPATAAA